MKKIQQRLFDEMYTGLMQQGKLSVSVSEKERTCSYRGEEGSKCAVGHIIPDDLYDAGMETNSARMVGMTCKKLQRHWLGDLASNGYVVNEFLDWLTNAQVDLHDSLRHHGDFKQDLKEAGKRFANEYELEWNHG